MILILANWIITLVICIAIGDLALSRIKSSLSLGDVQNGNILFKKFLVGLATITFTANLASVFIKISLVFFLAVLLVALLWSILNLRNTLKAAKGYLRQVKKIHPLVYLIIFVVLVVSLFKCSLVSQNADHAGYYLQMAKWIENYKLIPGTALFNGRLGFNSAWHMSSAVFSQAYIFDRGLYDLNGLLYFVFHLVGIKAIVNLISKENVGFSFADILLGISLIFPFTFLIDSIDVDYPTVFIGIFLVSECIRRIERRRFSDIDLDFVCYTMIALYLFTIRPFSVFYFIPILLIVLSNLKKGSLKSIVTIPVLGLIYVLPWLIRNYYISGYLIYPIYYVDLFNPDWKIPLAYAQNTFLVVKEFAQIEFIRSDYLYDGVAQLRISQWFETWCQNTKGTLAGCFVMFGLPISIAAYIVLLLTKGVFKKLKIFLTILFLILLFWFFNFPSIRFAWAFIFSFMVLTMSLLISKYKGNKEEYIGKVILFLFLLSLARTSFLTISEMNNIKTVWLSPMKEMIPTDVVEEKNGTLIYKRSRTEYCGALVPACIPYHNPYKIKMRGSEFEEGFVLNQ